jgi:hypothetical protein
MLMVPVLVLKQGLAHCPCPVACRSLLAVLHGTAGTCACCAWAQKGLWVGWWGTSLFVGHNRPDGHPGMAHPSWGGDACVDTLTPASCPCASRAGALWAHCRNASRCMHAHTQGVGPTCEAAISAATTSAKRMCTAVNLMGVTIFSVSAAAWRGGF